MHRSTYRTRIKDSRGDMATNAVIYVTLGIICFLMLYPIIFIFSASLSDPNAVAAGRVWLWPVDLQFGGYQRIFGSQAVFTGYRNSLLYLIFGTALNIFVTFTGAFALSRKELFGRGPLTFFVVFTMWFNGGMIPTFLLVRSLGLVDNPLVMVIFGAVNAFNLIITRAFIQYSVPEELQDAARIDGCTDFGICWKIVFPLSGPVIAVLVLFYGLEHWNGFFRALMFISSREYQPLQIILREILLQNQTLDVGADVGSLREIEMAQRSMRYALVIVASLPMLIIYPFLQRFFTKGMMIGSLKG